MIFDALLEPDLFLIRRFGASTKDSLGRTTRTLLSETPADGLLIQTGSLEGEAYVVDEFRATLPLRADLRADDEVVSRGKRYTVKGTPFAATVPRMPSVGVLTAVLKYVGPVTA